MTEDEVKALFLLSSYTSVRFKSIDTEAVSPPLDPWWLVQVPEGTIRLGWWRPRVFHIGWSQTPFRGRVVDSALAMSDTYARVSDYGQAVVCLAELRVHLRRVSHTITSASDDETRKCTVVQRQMDKAYPKTCELCGLGPCRISAAAAESFLRTHVPVPFDPATQFVGIGIEAVTNND